MVKKKDMYDIEVECVIKDAQKFEWRCMLKVVENLVQNFLDYYLLC